MTLVDFVAYAVATVLAVSRLLTSTKPYWKLVPAPVAVFLPSLVAMLPVLAGYLGVAHSELDVVNAFVVAGALLLPGLGVPTDSKPAE